MKDPHIDSLCYKLVLGEGVDFLKAPPIEEETKDFIFYLSEKEVIFKMKTHFAKESDARKIADEFLNTYLIVWGLEYNYNVKFLFKSSNIIDRQPSVNNVLKVCINTAVNIECKCDIRVSHAKFPKPIKSFIISPDVHTIYSRFNAAMHGKETLLSMAYMCFTIVVTSAGSRDAAAKKYNIDKQVLNKWGEIASTKGSGREARKLTKQGYLPLEPKEKEWIIGLIKKVIIRLGNYAYNPNQSFPKISFSDLPLLKL
jgi:hypothetical protein